MIFFQNLDIKTIILLGIVFGVLGFFVWNKFVVAKKKSPLPPSEPQQQVISDEQPVVEQAAAAPKILSV